LERKVSEISKLIKVFFEKNSRILSLVIVLSVEFFFVPCNVFCDTPRTDISTIFNRAVESYEKNEYPSAIRDFEQILDLGHKTGNIYYNLANSYLSNDELGKALINYEKAKIFIPQDPDLINNYRYARSLIKQDDQSGSGLSQMTFLNGGMGFPSLPSLIFLFIGCYFSFALFFIFLKIFKRSITLNKNALLFVFVVFALIFLYFRCILLNIETLNIVVPSVTDARFEPNEKSGSNYILYEGMKVNVLRNYRDWSRVKRGDGKIGWIKSNDLGSINP
jgi:tetratricopeptide (TPR) repeat protein